MNAAPIDLTRSLPAGRLIVLCGRPDDAAAWTEFLGSRRTLAIPLDPVITRPRSAATGATHHLARLHDVIGDLDGTGWLATAVNKFDRTGKATLLLPDPLDPTHAGRRRRFGRRHRAHKMLEDKTVVDTLWDTIGVPRAPSIIADGPCDITALAARIDQGNGVVCSSQPIGSGPTAGGDGICWWAPGHPPPPINDSGSSRCRLRLMPMLAGLPVRLHGLVTASHVIPFPPLEIVTLRRPNGTFLCAGSAPTLHDAHDLAALTTRIGERLHRRVGYLGAFSADGIVTADGFRPTDLNARLTSAMEAAPPALRVRLHAANLAAREDQPLNPTTVSTLAEQTFGPSGTYTLYGAATHVADDLPRRECQMIFRFTFDRSPVTCADVQ
jgi:hypothetical protein